MDSGMDKNLYRVWEAMWKTRRKVDAELQQNSSAILTRTQFYLMRYIMNNGPCTISQLADLMEVKTSAISTMIERLVQNGLLTRFYGEHDRRNVFVSLTDKGKESVIHDLRIAKEVFSRYLSCLTPEELETFANLFEKIVHHDK
ncbi:MarR family winged helix-turn-helix transcriptional regulator [Brevibacillus fulvus]|uniref:DNA-binding MarR family transcriptional regulator n=1 Tax=Brevibacillus fulvus TaxID=1125967 RepID=A0A938XWK6_9BACL|nr:MarR family transcriptional regulator [Brevibacillus fulvus]MBM7589241.1 DNA-binding MarR family transcriptional regulator [Brevibacillus fulvus]